MRVAALSLLLAGCAAHSDTGHELYGLTACLMDPFTMTMDPCEIPVDVIEHTPEDGQIRASWEYDPDSTELIVRCSDPDSTLTVLLVPYRVAEDGSCIWDTGEVS